MHGRCGAQPCAGAAARCSSVRRPGSCCHPAAGRASTAPDDPASQPAHRARRPRRAGPHARPLAAQAQAKSCSARNEICRSRCAVVLLGERQPASMMRAASRPASSGWAAVLDRQLQGPGGGCGLARAWDELSGRVGLGSGGGQGPGTRLRLWKAGQLQVRRGVRCGHTPSRGSRGHGIWIRTAGWSGRVVWQGSLAVEGQLRVWWWCVVVVGRVAGAEGTNQWQHITCNWAQMAFTVAGKCM